MRVTIKNIAERSGLSLQTVSRILNGHAAQYQEATRDRVINLADEMGYRPNSSAKAMRSGRFGSVALLLSEKPYLSILPVGCREGIQDVLVEREVNLILSRFSDDTLTNQERLPRILREIMADGLLIVYNADLPQPMVDMIVQHKIPAIWINSRQPADCVFPDDRDAAARATKRLISLGHRSIAFAYVAVTSHYSFAERFAGYEETMQAAGLTPRKIQVGIDFAGRDAILAATPFLEGADRVTAFVAYTQEAVTMLLSGAFARGLSSSNA